MNTFNDEYAMTIDGRLVSASNTFEAFNPATKETIATVPDASKDQLDEAVASARKAFATWSATDLAQRQAAVAAIGKIIEDNAEALMALLTKEQGKPRAGAEWEVLNSAAWCAAGRYRAHRWSPHRKARC